MSALPSLTPAFELLFQSAPGLYLVLAPDLTIVAVSDAYLRATMTVRDEILGRALFEVFPDDPGDPTASGVATLSASLKRVIELRQPDTMAVQKYDIRRPEHDGGGFEERYWSPINSPVLDHAGRLVYVIHRVEDVTDFVRLRREGSAQTKLAEELRTRAGQVEAEVYRRAQEIQEANKHLRELRDELESRVDARTAALSRANEELRREIAERQRAEEALRKSEEQLRQSQKLEAVGRLAGGIAHDFNNLLSVILSYSAELLESVAPDAPGHAELKEIEQAGRRAADLTRQMLAFSRQQVLSPKILNLNEILVGVGKMLTRVLGEDIELRLLPSANLGKVRADPGQVEQVLMNLVVNARDAMPTGGKLTIETGNVEFDETYARDHVDVFPGSYVMIAVTDSGVGMDKATQARAFEPFFTTKERGKGTGLGLSTVFGIVKQSGGHIWLYSEVGAGTTFKIYLPSVEGTSIALAVKEPGEPQGGSETILLVEDEEQIRRVASGILRRCGYNVLEAQDTEDALRLCETHDGGIHLLLTDVVMPKMSGPQLTERMRAMRPDLRVLFMSGYTDDSIFHHGVLDAGMAFLQKPLTPDAVMRRVREVLDAIDPSPQREG